MEEILDLYAESRHSAFPKLSLNELSYQMVREKDPVEEEFGWAIHPKRMTHLPSVAGSDPLPVKADWSFTLRISSERSEDRCSRC